MAEADWTLFNAATHHALDAGDVSQGVSTFTTPPNGGGSFVYGFHSLNNVIGVAGRYYTGVSAFNPIASGKGGSIRGALRRYAAGTEYAPFLALIAGTDLETAKAYMLGLSDSDPYQYVLRKGLGGGGLDPTGTDVLRVSDESFTSNTAWHHLRLDVIVNPHGDVILNVYYNSTLATTGVTAPTWSAVPGMDSYVDDANGVLTGSAPLASDFRGMMGHFNDGEVGKVSLIDHVELFRQISP